MLENQIWNKMESMNENQSVEIRQVEAAHVVEKRHDTFLKELWNRYGNNSYTIDDLARILDLVRDDENLHELYEAWNSAWNNAPTETEEQQEALRREVAQLIARHERNREIRPVHVSSLRKIDRFRKIWYAAAAALLLGLLIPAVHLYMKPKTEQTVLYVEEVTGRGEIKTVFLSDQTEVTLNAESRLKYPANFTGDERSVELAGEALFDVTHDPARPFTVKTASINIRVVGTVFDVKEYANDLTASVSVASGKVEVGLDDEKIMLEKNQQLKMDKNTGLFEKTTFDADNYLSWTEGTLYFHRTPIREVVNTLNRHYPHADIELAEGEYYNTFTGKYNKDYKMENYLKGIAYSTGLKYKKTENKYVLYNEE